MRPQCVGCEKPIHDHQVRLTLWHDAGGGGRHTKSVYVHEACQRIYERVKDWHGAEKASAYAMEA